VKAEEPAKKKSDDSDDLDMLPPELAALMEKNLSTKVNF
jgi:hypothetical protein